MEELTHEKVEECFVDEKDKTELGWQPVITPFIENLESEIGNYLDKLTCTAEIPSPLENETRSFYMRIVENHIEIGVVNIEFIR